MNKIFYMSDLHFDTLQNDKNFELKNTIFNFSFTNDSDKENDFLILTGDIGEIHKNYSHSIIPFLENASHHYNKIFYILGNHEFYKTRLDNALLKITEQTQHIKNLFILNNDAHQEEKFIILGATLWTNYDNYNRHLMFDAQDRQKGMRDFKKIHIKKGNTYQKININDIISEHLTSKNFLINNLEKYKNSNKKIIIATHHAPSFKSCLGDDFDGAYACNMEKEIEKFNPSFWIHGHTHESQNYFINKTNILCNPLGYSQKDHNPLFSPNCYFNIL